jgi:hypothetical protein
VTATIAAADRNEFVEFSAEAVIAAARSRAMS